MKVIQLARRVIKKILAKTTRKSWAASQSYELEHAVLFMETPKFRELATGIHSGQLNMSKGHADEIVLREFFRNDKNEWNKFVDQIRGKSVLEIGPSAYSPLVCWDVASERYVIEPLYNQIDKWQKENVGFSIYEGVTCFAHGADALIPELVGKIDGAIYCRNCLDHTPHWPFILANMSLYAKSGCQLLLWTDLDHGGEADEGHYDITPDIPAFRRLVELMGFEILGEYQDANRKELNWGCVAVKR